MIIPGAWVYELLDPILTLLALALPISADITLEVGLLIVLLYSISWLSCFLARISAKAVIYICFEMREQIIFYLLLLGLVSCVLLLVPSLLIPPIVSEDRLIVISGLAVMGILLFGGLTVWFYVRYRWSLNRKRRVFDHDIGLAWSHMTDPRRARLDFNWGR